MNAVTQSSMRVGHCSRGSSDRLAASRREWIEVPSGDAADPAKRVTALREAVAMLAGRIGDAVAAATTHDARKL
jgi:hypothetical protein